MPKYTAKRLSDVSSGPGFWNHQLIGVFDDETQIGEYKRNYSNFYNTFFPFQVGEQWLALYSRAYTATRIMSLPDCKDLGGEEPVSHGFCPVAYLVPELMGQILNNDVDPEVTVANHDAAKWALKVPTDDGKYWQYYWPGDKDHPNPDPVKDAEYKAEHERTHKLSAEWEERHPWIAQYAPWGFVSGCVWGDDSGGWKCEFLDLSRATEGIVVRDQRFGYLELPIGVDLKDAICTRRIDVLNAPPEKTLIDIALPQRFDLTGKKRGDD